MKIPISPKTALTRIAVVALAGGSLAAAQVPALAAPSAGPAVTIAASSNEPKVTGFTWVLFIPGKFGAAQLKGTVTGGGSPDVLRLFAQQFPFHKQPVEAGAPVSASARYSFTVRPQLATQYKVELFASSTAKTPLASSPTTIVYLAGVTRYSGIRKCKRPVCHQTLILRTTVPASTLRAQRAERWIGYLGLKLKPRKAPSVPTSMRRGEGDPKFSRGTRLSATRYQVKLSITFRINNDGYNFIVLGCQPDIEAKDGLNLPGHHGCGKKVISARFNYIG